MTSMYDILYDRDLDDNKKLVDYIGWATIGSDQYRLYVFRLLMNLVRDIEILKKDIQIIQKDIQSINKGLGNSSTGQHQK
jgi:hypothetical protein